MITFAITSSDRFDLLERTLDSFFNTCDDLNLISAFILNEDSGSMECLKKIVDRYGQTFQIIFSPERQGLSRALDNLIALAPTEYIFTCEDDWYFDGNRKFLSESLTILEANKDIHQVWIRNFFDHVHPIEGATVKIQEINIKYVPKWKGWNGFSWNPGLRRKSDINLMFAKGFSQYGDEFDCCERTKRFNYKVVSLVNTSIKHIGYGRHTEGFKV